MIALKGKEGAPAMPPVAATTVLRGVVRILGEWVRHPLLMLRFTWVFLLCIRGHDDRAISVLRGHEEQRFPHSCSALAVLLAVEGHSDVAVTFLRGQILARPDFPRLHEWLVDCYMEDGKYREAVCECKQLELLCHRSTDHYRTQYLLGWVLFRTGDTQGAMREFMKACEFNPHKADGQYAVGVCLFWMGFKAEALKRFHRALEIDRDHPQANAATAAME